MRQGTYLNVILTINAVLLAALIWTQWTSGPAMASEATAQEPPPGGIPNSAAQRQKMIESLGEIKQSVDATRRVIESGKLRVEVTNLSEIDFGD